MKLLPTPVTKNKKMTNNEREPKGIIQQNYGTTGSPKDRKVLGDGVTIVAEQTLRRLHTSAVIRAEREVSQLKSTSTKTNLSPGLKMLEVLANQSRIGKVRV